MNPAYNVASILLSFARTALAATPAGVPENARVCVVPGQLAWDDCECGLIAVEFNGSAFSSNFFSPQPVTSDGCRSYATFTYTTTVLRCVPGTQGAAHPPTCEQLDAAAQTFYDDGLALMDGMSAALIAMAEANVILEYGMNGLVPTGPQGNCVGQTQQVTVALSNRWGKCAM